MATSSRRRTLRAAEEIFNALGSTFQDLKLYDPDHPRLHDGLARLEKTIHEFFLSPDHSHENITFTLGVDQILFHGLPLLNLQPSGGKFLAHLKSVQLFGLQLLPSIDESQLSELLVNLRDPAELLEENGAESERDFRVVSELDRDLLNRPLRGSSGAMDRVEMLDLPNLELSRKKFTSFFGSYQKLVKSLEAGRSVDFSRLHQASREAVNLFWQNPDTASQVTGKRYFDDFTFHHSLNVCILATAAASKILDDQEQIGQIALAALLHDVGKSQVPAEILYKSERLNESELQQMRRHPVVGAEILLGIRDLPPLCVDVAYSHHIHDAEGTYPLSARDHDLNWVSELVSVVDIYEALTAFRPYKKGLPPVKAFEIMFKMTGLRTRWPFIKLLFDCVGPFPAGSVVELNSGERAQVVRSSSRTPTAPIVRLISDSSHNPVEEALEVDLNEELISLGERGRSITGPVVLNSPEESFLDAELISDTDRFFDEVLEDELMLMAQEG